ncbi:MAG: hypothetical protein WKF28_04390 [Rubrobacteraceae bacterium]
MSDERINQMDVYEEWLNQTDVHEEFSALGRGPWTVLYRSCHRSKRDDLGIYCGLASPDYRESALSSPNWDLMVTDGRPGFSQGPGENGELVTKYHSEGSEGEVEPLVLHREFHGVRPSHLEIVQEFRLFHNLWWNNELLAFMKAHEDGSEEVAIEVSESEVRVKTRFLRQYQAARQLDLLLFMDSVRHSPSADVALPVEENWRSDTLCATRYPNPNTMLSSPMTRYLATRVIPPLPVERSGIWPYEEVDDYFPDFVIGYDDEGEEVRYSCNPDALANYFGANPDAPHYLTPVFFKREVLQKYYNNPEKYSVEDGHLRCSGLWGLRMDNDSPEHVVVFLGDLGRDLPKSERDYWRSHNVAPNGSMSQTGTRRAFLGEWAEAQSPDLKFRHLYRQFVAGWREQEGWALFREPIGSDTNLLQQLRIPLSESQTEFEDSIGILAKLLCDGLNDKEIQWRLPSRIEGEKSISKLERWLRQEEYENVDRDIKLLRDIQTLRSTATAHRKSSKYEQTLGKILGNQRGRAAIITLLDRANLLLVEMREWRLIDS